MKVLVTIANYGTGNDRYLARVLDEYRRMRDKIDIVVTSNLVKNLGKDVEVVVGLPRKNPRSLAFAHKQIFADRRDDYDLFVYLEDDILISQRNIDAFLEMTKILPENECAGFLRTEVDSSGKSIFWMSTANITGMQVRFAFEEAAPSPFLRTSILDVTS